MESNLSAGEWKTLRNLASDRSIAIKGADEDSSLVVWNRADYILEDLNGKQVYKEVHCNEVYKEVTFNENILTGLVEKSNKIFNHLCSHRLSHRLISESELKYIT